MLGKILRTPRIRNETNDEDRGWKLLSGLFGSGNKTMSGEIVTPESAISNIGVVFACVVIRSNAMSKLPLQVFRKTTNGRERVTNHPVAYLLEKRPNKHQSPSQFKKFIETSLLLWGNAFVKQVFDRRGRITELLPLQPSRVSINKQGNDYFYNYTNDQGNVEVFTEDEIWHIPYITTDGKIGKAPITVARENAGVLMAMQRFESNFYKNGTITKGALKVDEALESGVKEVIKDEWRRMYGGGNNAGDIAILDHGMEWLNISLPLKDAEFVLSRKMTRNEIATIFNVPAFMLNDLEKATFNNFEQMKLLYAENTLMPSCIAIEEEINYKAFLDNERDLYVKFNMNGAMRGDGQSRVTYYKGLMEVGGITPNEIRRLEYFDHYTLPEADMPYMTRNLSPLDAIKDNATGGGGRSEEIQEHEDTQ